MEIIEWHCMGEIFEFDRATLKSDGVTLIELKINLNS